MELTTQDKENIIYLVTKKYQSPTKIAKEYNKSRQTVYNVLKEYGIDIKKFQWIDVVCDYCGKEFKKRRCMVRNTKRDFCCTDHKMMYIKEHPKEWSRKRE